MKEFAAKLKEHLEDISYMWKSSYTVGGCETCGWDGDEREEIDGDALWAEIDKFCAEFEEKK